MTQITAGYYDAPALEEEAPPQTADYLPRWNLLPLPFLAPVVLCGLSWMAGGEPMLTDAGFVLLTILCIIFLIGEFVAFNRRFGIGGMVLFPGVLIWFSYDYMVNWFGRNFADGTSPIEVQIIAKAAFLHSLFIMAMVAGLLIPFGRFMERLMLSLPEPRSPNFYFVIVIALFVVGMIPYFAFTRDPFYVSIYNTFLGEPVRWTVGRSGNVNEEGGWGAYAALLVDFGQMGGVFAAMYALLVARSSAAKVAAWSIWFFWTLMAFGSGVRGHVIFMVVPVVGFSFIKYHAAAAEMLRKFSLKAYVIAFALLFGILALVQIQGRFRAAGYANVEWKDVKLFKAQGNTMFSEGLPGYALIPYDVPFFFDRFPGEALLRPIPQTTLTFLTGPIPRALWKNKPIDDVWEWYNKTYQGKTQGQEGTTISQGLVGHWYFRYGIAGIIEGGLLMGWLMVTAERVLQRSRGRILGVLIALSVATWLFRCFRGLNFNNLYGLLLGLLLMSLLIKMTGSAVKHGHQQ